MLKKFLPFVLLAIIIVVGISYIISQSKKADQKMAQEAAALEESQPDEELVEYCQITEKGDIKTVSCAPIPGMSYEAFTFTVPSDWEIEEKNVGDHLVNIYKDDYYIVINHTTTHGASCKFNDSGVNEEVIEPMDYTNANYVEISTGQDLYRRFVDERLSEYSSRTLFSTCVKARSGQVYQKPSAIGFISYNVPREFDEKKILELDEIVKTMKLQSL